MSVDVRSDDGRGFAFAFHRVTFRRGRRVISCATCAASAHLRSRSSSNEGDDCAASRRRSKSSARRGVIRGCRSRRITLTAVRLEALVSRNFGAPDKHAGLMGIRARHRHNPAAREIAFDCSDRHAQPSSDLTDRAQRREVGDRLGDPRGICGCGRNGRRSRHRDLLGGGHLLASSLRLISAPS